ncbi:unnamed protein product [Sphagnum balticum]
MNVSALVSGCETKCDSIINEDGVSVAATKYDDEKHVKDAVLDMEERVSAAELGVVYTTQARCLAYMILGLSDGQYCTRIKYRMQILHGALGALPSTVDRSEWWAAFTVANDVDDLKMQMPSDILDRMHFDVSSAVIVGGEEVMRFDDELSPLTHVQCLSLAVYQLSNAVFNRLLKDPFVKHPFEMGPDGKLAGTKKS